MSPSKTAPPPTIEEVEASLAALPKGTWRFVGEADDDFNEPRVILDEPLLNRGGVETPLAGSISNGVGPFIANAPRYVQWLLDELKKAQQVRHEA